MNLKKLILTNLPYVFAVWPASKIAAAVRLSPGEDLATKLFAFGQGFEQAFADWLPSLHPTDLCIGLLGALLLKLAFYLKSKNAKKFRQGVEYGSARWGTAADIRPFIDKTFTNNVLFTKTERLTMESRPKDPKYARNKNVMVIGGSGSGKTRFFLLPNIMQLHSSYCITDPKRAVF